MKDKLARTLILFLLLLNLFQIGISYGANMRFSELIEKMANGETLSPIEKQELVLKAKDLEQAESIVNAIIQPGTLNMKIDGLTAHDANLVNANVNVATITNATIESANIGDATLGSDGITLENSGTATLAFKDSGGSRLYLYIASTPGNSLAMFGDRSDALLGSFLINPAGNTHYEFYMKNDPAMSGRPVVRLLNPDVQWGERFSVGDEIELRAKGTDASTATYIKMLGTNNTPDAPLSQNGVNIYMKLSKIVFQYNDAGTVRYKYLDLSGTGVTWQQSTVAP